MRFKDIEGQRVLINHLTEIIDSGRVSHAQMFLGPTNSGSLALAIAYAQYLNCENRQHYGEGSELRADSCGQCPNCRKYEELMHTDLHFVFPNTTTSEVTSKPCSEDFQAEFRDFLNEYHQYGKEDDWYTQLGVENKQGVIREKDADNIVKTLALKSYEGGYKVVVIWMAERMNRECANKLLKTLEEPTDKTLLLLVAESRDRMLSTIISRVQQVVVPDMGMGLSEERRREYARLFVSSQKRFLQYVQESLRACFLKTVAGIALPGELEFGDEKFDTFFPTMITVNNIEQMNQAITDAMYAIERNANARITFMQLSFTMSKLIKKR